MFFSRRYSLISIGDFIVMKPEVQRRPEVWTKLWEGIARNDAETPCCGRQEAQPENWFIIICDILWHL